MKPRPDRRRPEPYYKVQHRDPVTLAWKDRRKEAFDTLREALIFVQTNAAADRFRIIEFNAGRPKTVYEQH
jgi:hypothetical protein